MWNIITITVITVIFLQIIMIQKQLLYFYEYNLIYVFITWCHFLSSRNCFSSTHTKYDSSLHQAENTLKLQFYTVREPIRPDLAHSWTVNVVLYQSDHEELYHEKPSAPPHTYFCVSFLFSFILLTVPSIGNKVPLWLKASALPPLSLE